MKYFRFMKPDIYIGEIYGIDILWFRLWHFYFRWFIDCGCWFLYLEWHTKKYNRYLRFGDAGLLKGKYMYEAETAKQD